MKPKVEPSLLHAVSTHKCLGFSPIFFSRLELTDETNVWLRSPFRASDFHMEATTSSSFEPSFSLSSVYFSVPLKKPERYPSPYLIVSPDSSFRPYSVDASHAFLGSMFLLDEKLKLFQGSIYVHRLNTFKHLCSVGLMLREATTTSRNKITCHNMLH
ncbi:unnamed protein product [Brassica oleracea var. botrytis]|nr:unnamed protein product [Brassica napus]